MRMNSPFPVVEQFKPGKWWNFDRFTILLAYS